MIRRNLNRLRFAFAGIWYALLNDFSYRWQFIAGGTFCTLFAYFMWPLREIELFFLILAWVLILITELQNSSFEAALDRLHPELHEDIGHSKDMAAGAVLTAGLFLVFVVIMIGLY